MASSPSRHVENATTTGDLQAVRQAADKVGRECTGLHVEWRARGDEVSEPMEIEVHRVSIY